MNSFSTTNNNRMEKAGKATSPLGAAGTPWAGGACERLRAGGISVQGLWLACKSQQLSQLCCPILLPPAKGASRNNWVVQTPGLPAGLQVGTKARGHFYIRPLSVQQTRERLYREVWGATGVSGDCGDYPWLEVPKSTIAYPPFCLHRVGGGSIQVLWPTSKVTAECT